MPLRKRSEQYHHAVTRNRLAAIVRSSADAIVGETLDGIITDWNPAAERLYGYKAEEVIGKHFSILVPPEEHETLAGWAARVLRGESIEGLEAVRRTKDGRRLDISLTISPVYDDTGQIIATSAIVRDISAVKAHERALAASEERFRVAFEDAPTGIALTAPDTRVLQVNQALCDIVGYSKDELLATTFQEITHPDDVAGTRVLVERALIGEITQYEQEKRYFHKNGHIVHVLVNGSLVRNERGAPRYFISHVQNISDRKAAEAELAAAHEGTREILQRVTDGFYALDRDWCFTYLNDAAERMLGRTREELLGKNIWDAFPPTIETPVYGAYQQAVATGQTTAVEFFYPSLDSWFEVRAYPAENGLSLFFRDITARKRADDEIRDALDAAHAANRARGHFLAMMSHELRTPMQAVLGYADLLLAGSEGPLTEGQWDDIRTIRQGAERMMALVDQMLDLSRLEAGQLELVAQPVDLGDVIEQVRQDVAPQAAIKGLDLVIEVPSEFPQVLGDATGLRQILLNLVGNAVKFTERGTVRIRLEAKDAGVEVDVSDTGIGITPEAMGRIFEEFRQGETGMTRRYGGAGLGLAIAKRLAEHHGGWISATSHPYVGSTFTLHLPLSEADLKTEEKQLPGEPRRAAPTPLPQDLDDSAIGTSA